MTEWFLVGLGLTLLAESLYTTHLSRRITLLEHQIACLHTRCNKLEAPCQDGSPTPF